MRKSPLQKKDSGHVVSSRTGISKDDVGKLEERISKLESEVKDTIDVEVKKASERFNQEIQNRETKTIEILAIFFTLFTFISVDVSIFNRVDDLYTAIWFILLFTLCSIIILSTLFLFISREKEREKKFKIVLGVSLAILVLCVFLPNFTENPKLNPTDITKEYLMNENSTLPVIPNMQIDQNQ